MIKDTLYSVPVAPLDNEIDIDALVADVVVTVPRIKVAEPIADLDVLVETSNPRVSYLQIAEPIRMLGYACLPRRTSEKGKEPAVAFGWITSSDCETVQTTMASWDSSEQAGLWLLDALPGSGMPDLDAIDYDVLSEIPWGETTFSPSPLTQTTGRDGGGLHAIYRRDPSRPRDETGSITKIGGRSVDWKTWHGFILAPGSLHRSGRRYQLFWHGQPIEPWELTREMIESLPILDRTVMDRVLASTPTAPSDEPMGVVEVGFGDDAVLGTGRTRTRSGKMLRAPGDPKAVIPSCSSSYSGMTVTAAAHALRDGDASIACPFDDDGAHKSDLLGSPTAKLIARDGHPVGVTCFACSTYYYLGFSGGYKDLTDLKCSTTSGSSLGSDGSTGASNRPSKSYLHDLRASRLHDGLPALTVLTQNHLDTFGGGYIPHTPSRARITFVRAPWAKGKTELVKAWVKVIKTSATRGPIVSVVHRRNLATQQSVRLGLPDYRDIVGDIARDAVVCLDSIKRIQLYEPGPDGTMRMIKHRLVLLDEITQMIQHLYSGTLGGPESLAAYEHLKTLLQNAEQIVCLDADLDDNAIRWVRHLLGLPADSTADQEFRVVDVPPPHSFRIDQDPVRTDSDLIEDWGNSLCLGVFCQSRREATAKAIQMQGLRPDAKIMLVTSDTVLEPAVKAFLADPSLASQYDALVYSPSLGTGYSIDIKNHFDRIYAYSRAGVGTVQDLMQGVHRIRHPKDNEIRIACPEGGTVTRDTDPQTIYTTLIALGDATVRSYGRDHITRTADYAVGTVVNVEGALRLDPWRTGHTTLYSQILSYERKNGGQGGARGDALRSYLDTIGAIWRETGELDGDIAALVSANTKEARKQAREQRAERIASADVIEIAKAREIREPSTRAQSDSIERAKIADFYGSADAEVVLADDEGKLRAKARAYARFSAYHKDRASVKHMDRQERDQGVPASHAGFYTVHITAISAILREAGLSGDPATWGDRKLDATVIGPKIAHLADLWAKPLGELGITVRSDVVKNPIRLISAILRQMGIDLSAHRSGSDTRTYTVSATSIQKMSGVSGRYLERILDRDRGGHLIRDPVAATIDQDEPAPVPTPAPVAAAPVAANPAKKKAKRAKLEKKATAARARLARFAEAAKALFADLDA